jgi:hypothetical protein
MNKQLSIILAMTGAILLAASQAQAQSNTYNNEDLLLNFRNFSTQTDPNVTIDLGNVNSFVTTVAGLPGGTAVLDTGTGFTASLSTGFSYAGLTGLLGAPASGNEIGFSAAAADSTGDTGLLFLTRTQSTGTLTPPAVSSSQQGLTAQATTAQAISLIGFETTTATTLPGSSGNSVYYSSGDANSYQSQAQDPGNFNVIDYGGSQSTANGAGGKMELEQSGSANLFEALWEVPISGSGSDTYEGYFTFQTDGEVDFTTVAAVPEPSTYVLLLVTGVFGFAFRRQIHSLIA